jgi:hypothetical protein
MTKAIKKSASKIAVKMQTKAPNKNPITKQAKIITLLQREKGATLAELVKLSGWQDHSIRGFMSGTLKKRMGFNIISEKNSKGTRRYRIGNSNAESSSSASTSLTSADAGGQR